MRTSHFFRNQMKRLFSNNLPASDHKQTQPHAPLQADQTAVIAKRCPGKHTMNDLLIGQSYASELMLSNALEMMNIEIFISLSLGVPKNGHLDTLNFIKRNATNPPLG